MQNYSLLKELGSAKKPVMLKRGLSATVEDWLMSAEYILSNGNPEVFLCERGIRTFETYTRNTFDISAIPVVHKRSHLPVFGDPSHATGLRDKVIPMARAAVAAGADGLMVEVHHDPEKALSDGPQALLPEQFSEMMKQIRLIANVIGRTM
jgi:3-deoxy-7-phosphoheptulonate synthase